jgi:hypothetical protein
MSILQIAEVDRPLVHGAHHGYRRVRTEALLALGERALEVVALADPQPVAAGHVTDHFLPFDVESVGFVGVHGSIIAPGDFGLKNS